MPPKKRSLWDRYVEWLRSNSVRQMRHGAYGQGWMGNTPVGMSQDVRNAAGGFFGQANYRLSRGAYGQPLYGYGQDTMPGAPKVTAAPPVPSGAPNWFGGWTPPAQRSPYAPGWQPGNYNYHLINNASRFMTPVPSANAYMTPTSPTGAPNWFGGWAGTTISPLDNEDGGGGGGGGGGGADWRGVAYQNRGGYWKPTTYGRNTWGLSDENIGPGGEVIGSYNRWGQPLGTQGTPINAVGYSSRRPTASDYRMRKTRTLWDYGYRGKKAAPGVGISKNEAMYRRNLAMGKIGAVQKQLSKKKRKAAKAQPWNQPQEQQPQEDQPIQNTGFWQNSLVNWRY